MTIAGSGEGQWDSMAAVGRVARPHGIRGHVVINLETDFPQDRFRTGALLYWRRAGEVQQLTLAAVRFQGGRPVVKWAGIDDINQVLPYVGGELRVPLEWLPRLSEGLFYRHDLVGCEVRTLDGGAVGVVRDVTGPLVGSCLVVDTAQGEVLIPLAAEICRSVDVPGHVIVIDPPQGLLDLNASQGRRRD
mgnify:CR=1 FL=1